MHDTTIDITFAFSTLAALLGRVVEWNQTHYIQLFTYRVSFFNIEIAVVVAFVILSNVFPMFHDIDGDVEQLAGTVEDSDFDDYDDSGDW